MQLYNFSNDTMLNMYMVGVIEDLQNGWKWIWKSFYL